jgi:hypothetical protein
VFFALPLKMARDWRTMIVSQDLIEQKFTVLTELSGHGVGSMIPLNLFLLS